MPMLGIPGTGGIGGFSSVTRRFFQNPEAGSAEGLLGGLAATSLAANGGMLGGHAVEQGQLNHDRRIAAIEDCKRQFPDANHARSTLNF